jgi:hypothetical protein
MVAVMRKQNMKSKKSLTLAPETLRTLQTDELRLVAGGWTTISNANDKTCNLCPSDTTIQ